MPPSFAKLTRSFAMTRLNDECAADEGLYIAAVSLFTCKQSLLAFLPSRVAALPHVVERIDTLAMAPADRLVEAVRQRDMKLVKVLAWDLRFDVLTVIAAATKETPTTLDAIGSCFRDWSFVGALHNAKQLDTIELLYRWIKGRGKKINALSSMLQIAATQGSFDLLEFASERIVVEFLGKDHDKWLTHRERRRKLSKIARVLQTFQSVQRWFHRAFYSAFRKGHRDFADRIYATYPSYPACITDKLFQTAVRVGWLEIVKFIFCKGRINAGASNRAFKGAADCRRCDILAFLLENADISVESVEGAFTRAIRSRSIDVATLLRSTKRVSPTLLNELFEDAIYLDIVQVLYDGELISTDVMEFTFHKVAGRRMWRSC